MWCRLMLRFLAAGGDNMEMNLSLLQCFNSYDHVEKTSTWPDVQSD